MGPQTSGEQTEIPDDWIKGLKQNVAYNPTARKAWKEIQDAGLEEAALFLLRGYAGGAKHETRGMYMRAENSSRVIKAALREEKLAQSRNPKRAHDRDLFRRRAQEAKDEALRSDWAMPADGVSTLGDELERVKRETGKDPPLDAVQRALVKAAGERSPMNSLYFLMLLQGYAAKFGVNLGLKALAALATCADPKRYPKEGLDHGTLGRYLRSYSPSDVDAILQQTLLPPPLKRR